MAKGKSNPVGALHVRLLAAYAQRPSVHGGGAARLADWLETKAVALAPSPAPVWPIYSTEDVVEAWTARRQMLGWSQPHTEIAAGIWDDETGKGSERLLSKIEPARLRTGGPRPYLRRPGKVSFNDTALGLNAALDLIPCMISGDIYRRLRAGGAAPRSAPGASLRTNFARLAAEARAEAQILLDRAETYDRLAAERELAKKDAA